MKWRACDTNHVPGVEGVSGRVNLDHLFPLLVENPGHLVDQLLVRATRRDEMHVAHSQARESLVLTLVLASGNRGRMEIGILGNELPLGLLIVGNQQEVQRPR